MSINLEKVDLLMERANIGYKDAYELLQQHDGNVIEALVYLERNSQTKQSNRQQANCSKTVDNIQNFISETHKKRFIVKNEEDKLIDLPLTVAAVAGAIALPVALPLLGLGLVTGHKINIKEPVSNVSEDAAKEESNNSIQVAVSDQQ